MQCSVAGQTGKEKSETGEEIKISSTNYGNIVTIYAKSSVYLNYK